MSEKKAALLGMNPSTASHRLVKDILWSFVQQAGHVCFRCGKAMTRETYSIEHKDSWMSAPDPVAAFFDLNNVAFSHNACNTGAAVKPPVPVEHGTPKQYAKGCRCSLCSEAKRAYRSKIFEYDSNKRRDRYKRLGS